MVVGGAGTLLSAVLLSATADPGRAVRPAARRRGLADLVGETTRSRARSNSGAAADPAGLPGGTPEHARLLPIELVPRWPTTALGEAPRPAWPSRGLSRHLDGEARFQGRGPAEVIAL